MVKLIRFSTKDIRFPKKDNDISGFYNLIKVKITLKINYKMIGILNGKIGSGDITLNMYPLIKVNIIVGK